MITFMNTLDRARFTPHLALLDDSGPYRDLIAPGIPIHPVKTTGILRAAPRLARVFRNIHADVVVSTMAHLNFSVLLAKTRAPKHTKFIVREAITPGYVLEHTGILKKAAASIGWRYLYPLADLVLSPTALVFEELRARVGVNLKRTCVLPNPVDVDHIQHMAVKPRNPDWPADAELKLACIGRLHHQKGLDLLLNGLIQSPPPQNWHLMLIGEGPERAALEDISRHPSLAGRISFAGLQSNPWAYMRAADAVLLPSRWEGLPNVALEALAAGTPVISSAHAGGIAEIAADTRHLQIAKDMPDFMARIAKIQATPQTTRASLLPEQFEKNIVAKTFAEILQAVAK